MPLPNFTVLFYRISISSHSFSTPLLIAAQPCRSVPLHYFALLSMLSLFHSFRFKAFACRSPPHGSFAPLN
jgi:hypothetical protein